MENRKPHKFVNSRNKILKMKSYKSQRLMYEIKNKLEKLKINEDCPKNNSALKSSNKNLTSRTTPIPKTVKMHAEYLREQIYHTIVYENDDVSMDLLDDVYFDEEYYIESIKQLILWPNLF